MATNEAKVKFTADTTAFNSAIKTANSSIKEMQSALKLNATQMSSTSSSTDQLRERLKLLEQEDQALAEKKEALNGKLQEAVKYFGEDSTEAANLRTQLNNLENQSEKVEQEIDATNAELDEQERAAKESESALGQLTSTISSQESELADLKTQYTNAVLEFGETSDEAQDLAGQITTLNSDLNENKAKLNSAVEATDNLTKSEDELGDQAEETGQSGVDSFNEMYDALTSLGLMKAVQQLGEAFKACVTTAADFEEQMSTVKALSGATADEMDVLSDAAKEMGATTSYTATEAAEALEYMALAGWSTEEMTDALAGVINLAAASGMDLAKASDIVTDDLSAFGLTAADANDFVDKLTYAMSSSNTTTEQLGEAYKNCAATSTQLGYDLDETTAALMVMADAGIKGGEAGTALSAIMTRLGNNTSGCRDMLEAYGVEVYDSQGNVRSLTDILSGCKDVWAGLTEEEKSSTAYTIAGRTAQSEFMTLMGDSTGTLETYTDGLRNCSGAAQEMADIKLDNFNGQVTLLKSAWDGLMTTMGEETLPVLTNLTTGLTGVVGWFDNLLENCPALTDLIIALGVGLATAAVGMAAMAAATTNFGNALKQVITDNYIGLIVAAVAALSAALVVFIAMQVDAADEEKQLRKEIKETTKAIEEQKEAYNEATQANEDEAERVQRLISDLIELSEQTEKSTSDQIMMQEIIDELNDAIPELGLAYDAEADAINYTSKELRELADAQAGANQNDTEVNNMTEAYEQLQAAEAEVTEAERQLAAARETEAQYTEYVSQGLYSYTDAQNEAAIAVGQLETDLENANKALADAEEAYYGSKDAVDAYGDAQEETAAIIQETATISEESAARMDSAMDIIISGTSDLRDAYAQCLEDAETSLFGQCDAWDEVAIHSEHSAEEVIKGLESQIAAAQNFNQNLDTLNNSNVEGMDWWLSVVAEDTDNFVEYVDIMANSNEEDQKAMIALWQENADVHTDVTNRYCDEMGLYDEVTEEMVQNVAEQILQLDMEDDAAQEAYQTLLGYCNGIDSGEILVSDSTRDFVFTVLDTVEDELGIKGGASSKMEDVGEDVVSGLSNGISGAAADAVWAARELADQCIEDTRDAFGTHSPSTVFQSIGEDTIQGLINGVNNKDSDATSAMTKVAQNAINGFDTTSTGTTLTSTGTNTIQGYISGINGQSNNIKSNMKDLANSAITKFKELSTNTTLKSSGENTIQGYINGIDNKSGSLFSKMTSVANSAMSKFKKALGISSPSTVMAEYGTYTDEGFVLGVEKEEAEVDRAMRDLATGATDSFNDSMDPLTVSTNTDYTASMNGVVEQSLFGISQQIMAMADEIAARPVVVQINGKNFATATSGDMDSAMGTRQQLVARGLSL